jgi:stalled ribosome rescue protein Dom34
MGSANKKNLVYQKLYSGIKVLVKKVMTISGNETKKDLIYLSTTILKENQIESPWIKRFLDDINYYGNKVVYGNKEILKKLKEGLLEVIMVKRKPSDKLVELANKVNCKIILTDDVRIFIYGDIVGMCWFPQEYY